MYKPCKTGSAFCTKPLKLPVLGPTRPVPSASRSVVEIGKQVVRLDEIDTAFLDLSGVDIAHFNAAIAVADDDNITDIDEQPVFNDTWYLVDNK